MRYLKMLALAAVTAGAFVALAGAGSASATVLCMANTTPCGEGEVVPKGQAIEMSTTAGGAMFIKAGFATIECTNSQMKGEVTEAGGSGQAVNISVSSLTFSNCNCPVTALKTGNLSLQHEAGTMNASVRYSGFEWATECMGVRCVFGTETKFNFNGGEPAEMLTGTASGTSGGSIPKKEGSLLCNSTSAWMVAYEVTNTSPLYVAES